MRRSVCRFALCRLANECYESKELASSPILNLVKKNEEMFRTCPSHSRSVAWRLRGTGPEQVAATVVVCERSKPRWAGGTDRQRIEPELRDVAEGIEGRVGHEIGGGPGVAQWYVRRVTCESGIGARWVCCRGHASGAVPPASTFGVASSSGCGLQRGIGSSAARTSACYRVKPPPGAESPSVDA